MILRTWHSRYYGFSYIEVLIAIFILAVAIVPAMEALQTSIQGAGVQESLIVQHYTVNARMETMLAESYSSLLAGAKVATDASTPTSFSDSAGGAERVVVLLALYDADAFPFTISDPNNDADNDIYTGDTSDLLWLRVEIENTAVAVESLKYR
ncbi:MAG: type II secretion system GspH family protein [Pseudomonadota bacterium]|nr:type II secretion system GspH family protein [Pseudomonadota bacterium]MDO7710409.1 type II secretion system GspH family protein [Pseudomonadota bacterium]